MGIRIINPMDGGQTTCSRNEMRSLKNCILHGIYLSLYGLVKYWSFPLFNYLRYGVIRLFAPGIKSSHICDGALIMFPWRVQLGKNSTLNQGGFINGFSGVNIGKDVRIAAYVAINSVDHAFSDPSRPIREQGYVCGEVNIEDDVWIGAHVCINRGVTIGRGSVIGAGSLVTKDIPPYSVAIGVPCRVIRKRAQPAQRDSVDVESA